MRSGNQLNSDLAIRLQGRCTLGGVNSDLAQKVWFCYGFGYFDSDTAARAVCSGNEVKQRFGDTAARAAHLWGGGKSAIWLQKYGFTRVLGTLAKLGFCGSPK